MEMPTYEDLLLPLLKLAGDNKEHSVKDAAKEVAEKLNLSEEVQNDLLPSGTQYRYLNRIGWARTHLKKAGLLEYPKRGYFNITPEGQDLLKEGIKYIDSNFLKRYEIYLKFIQPSITNATEEKSENIDLNSSTPEELVDYGYNTIKVNITDQIIDMIKSSTPEFFEHLVIDLLLGMGYGGSRKDAGKAIGKVGDEGIDGIINEDKLGLDKIYIQAKKWEGTVSRPEIQKFTGALHGKNAKKGVFITTSRFSKEAIEYANKIDYSLILIDGEKLTELMFDYNIGVSIINSYDIKKIDTDYFIDE